MDEGEFLELCRIPVCELEQCIANGQVRDAKTVAAMYYARTEAVLEERKGGSFMAKTILVVEDDKDIANIIVFNLERNGFETLEANDGPSGLKLALECAPDLILLDVMLPGIDGFEICRQVRERSQVPIIMLTAREEETDKILGLELGADDYVTKPFSTAS